MPCAQEPGRGSLSYGSDGAREGYAAQLQGEPGIQKPGIQKGVQGIRGLTGIGMTDLLKEGFVLSKKKRQK
jgi:hypothetical protein